MHIIYNKEGVIHLIPTRHILVCVTQQKTCERLIRQAAELREELKGELYVIHVAKNDWNFLDNDHEGEALEYLFEISKSVGANMTVMRSDSIVQTIIDFISENKISYIVMGESPGDHQENRFAAEIRKRLNNIEIAVIPQS